MFSTLKRKTKNAFYNLKGKIYLECNGVRAAFDSTYGSRWRRLMWRYKTEYEILEDIIDELRPDDVYFDIGASLGLHTCFPANKYPSCGEIVAVEPYPPNLEYLQKNVSLNGLSKVQVIEAAMSDSNGNSYFNGTSKSLNPNSSGPSVKTVVGDELINQGKLRKPNVVKIDVEGSEPLVIRGLTDTLQTNACRLLYLEAHLSAPHRRSIQDYGMNLTELKNVLQKCGFRLTKLKQPREKEIFFKGIK